MQTRGSIRKFVCKRCGKDAQDLQGGFTQYSKKFETNLVYENIDLCDKCFKITTREQKNLTHLQTAIELGVINKDDIETLKKFQTDKHFRKTVLEKIGVIKINGLEIRTAKHPPSYYRRLEQRKRKREANLKK